MRRSLPEFAESIEFDSRQFINSAREANEWKRGAPGSPRVSGTAFPLPCAEFFSYLEMMNKLSVVELRDLCDDDPEVISAAFDSIGWNKPISQYENYLKEVALGKRDVVVVTVEDRFAGYGTIVWSPSYHPREGETIPEISDLNVLPSYRCQGLGAKLLDELERRVALRCDKVTLGVGLLPDYGPAQRLYVKRGYVPDGLGLSYRGKPVAYGEEIAIDDDACLHFVKSLDP
ncbi:GNAT family N-acetyltransferase [bacterium]|nr:GNAT family N-acetyltransferase [bacterium]